MAPDCCNQFFKRGVRPFFSDKFDITKHKRYKELSDYDPKNAFDIEDYVKHQSGAFSLAIGSAGCFVFALSQVHGKLLFCFGHHVQRLTIPYSVVFVRF